MEWRTVAAAVALFGVPLTMAAGCAAARGFPGLPAARASGGAYPATFVASVESGRRAGSGIAVFSSSTGRLERWLVRGVEGLQPVTVGPGGRWVYYVSATSDPWCAGNGYTQPVLWRVPSAGGRPRLAGLRTGSIAFSPDGRMAAYVWTRHCGRTVWIVVRDKRAGTSRRIFLTYNAPTANNTYATAGLSWSADDTHLAVSVAPAAAINGLFVVDARKQLRPRPPQFVRARTAPSDAMTRPSPPRAR